jgi:hypothetical protein
VFSCWSTYIELAGPQTRAARPLPAACARSASARAEARRLGSASARTRRQCVRKLVGQRGCGRARGSRGAPTASDVLTCGNKLVIRLEEEHMPPLRVVKPAGAKR